MRLRTYSRFERALALALFLAAAGGLAAMAFGPPLRTWLANKAQISGAEEKLAAFRERARDLTALELARDALSEQDLRAQGLITAETAELAAAELQTIVRGIAARSGGAISTMRPETDGRDARLTIIDARMTIPADALADFLTSIDNARPLVFVEKIELRAAPQRGAADARADVLDAHLRATAYFAPGSTQ